MVDWNERIEKKGVELLTELEANPIVLDAYAEHSSVLIASGSLGIAVPCGCCDGPKKVIIFEDRIVKPGWISHRIEKIVKRGSQFHVARFPINVLKEESVFISAKDWEPEAAFFLPAGMYWIIFSHTHDIIFVGRCVQDFPTKEENLTK